MSVFQKERCAKGAGPRSRFAITFIPLTVVFAIVGVILWSAWPLVRPARHVQVVQAVFVRSDTPPPDTDVADSALGARDLTELPRDIPTVQAPGWLEAEPFYVSCTALADGIVERIEVLEGDRVEQGQVVARLVSDDSELRLRRAEADIESARALLAAARAERDAAERSWQEPVELERAVTSGRAALAESEAELAQLPSLIEAANATLTRLEEETLRVRQSTEQGAASGFELFAIDQRAAAQRAEVNALEATRPLIVARIDRLASELRAAERTLDLRIEDRRRLDAANAGLAVAEAGVLRAEVLRDEAALELERMTIRAPISGHVLRRLKGPGDKVMRMMDAPHSTHVAHLYDPARLRVRVDVPLADASHVSVGQRCEVVVEVLPSRVFKGEVIRSTHEADLQKNTLEFQVRVFDPDPMLRPEMLTRVKFLPPESKRAVGERSFEADIPVVLVPNEAIESNEDNPRVWLVTERQNGRGLLAAKPVRVLDRDEMWTRVSGDLRPGDLLAVGLDRPRAGERVVLAPAPAPLQGGQP